MPLNDNSLDEYPFSFRLFVIINIAIINSAAKIALFFIPAIVFDNLFTINGVKMAIIHPHPIDYSSPTAISSQEGP